jgi:hypothetical protein
MRKRLATFTCRGVILAVVMAICQPAAFGHEEGLQYQWTTSAYRKELLLQTRLLVVALVLFTAVKLASILIRKRRAA